MKLKLFRVLCLFVVLSMVLSIAPSVLADTTTAPQTTNAAPVVDAGAGATINAGDTFTSSGSFTDADSSSWIATVDYGDGSGSAALTLNADKTFGLSHVYAVAGSYTVTVSVTDDAAAVGTGTAVVVVNSPPPPNTTTTTPPADTTTTTVPPDTTTTTTTPPADTTTTQPVTTTTVSNAAPVVNAGSGATIDAGGTFTSSGSFTDADSTSWTATVDYGDGSGAAALTLYADKTFNLNHIYVNAGSYLVVVTVTDDAGAAGSDTANVTVITVEKVSLIVRLVKGLAPDAQRQVIVRDGGVETSSVPVLRLHFIDVPSVSADAVMQAYQSDPQVLSIERDKVRQAEGTPSDPSYAQQWALPKIGWDTVFGSVTPSGHSVIAVPDTGIDASHPDLKGIVLPGYSAFAGSDAQTDPNGHGTEMAGIAAALTDNGIGVAGVAYTGVSLLPVQVLGADGTGLDSDIINGIVWATDNGANVILMAFSNPGFSPALQDAIDYAWDSGVILVAATGNDGSSTVTYPAGDRGVMGISATDQNDALASSSNYGQEVFLAAPGADVATTANGGSYTSVTGTSASAAIVAGAAAFMKAVDPSLTNGTIVGRLARNTDPAGTQEQTGNGRLNMARALGDTATDQVQPAGVPPLGNGGPYVGPYVAAASTLDTVIVGSQNPVAITPGSGTSATYPITFTSHGNGTDTASI